MNWEAIVTPAFCSRLCISLLHSFWLIALLAIAMRAAEYALRRRSVQMRYAVYTVGLSVCLGALPFTFAMVDFAAGAPSTRHSVSMEPDLDGELRPMVNNHVQSLPSHDVHPLVVAVQPIPNVASDPERTSNNALPVWDRWSPWIVGLYVAGVIAMLVRLVGGVWAAHRLYLRAETIHEGPLIDLLRRVASRWSMRVVPALARAQEIVVPKVVGLVRPTILLPMSATTGLSIDQLAMILAHELAHVRRYDMWVNLLQRIAETVLFFNPAVWYISRRISTLREYCCDEMVCQTMTETQPQPQACYASALLRVAELGRENNSPQTTAGERSELATLAASGRSPSELRRRVAHLFGEPLRDPLPVSKESLLTLAILASLLVIGPSSWRLAADTETTLLADGVKNDSENDFGAVTDVQSENAQLDPKSDPVESPIQSAAQDDQTLRFPEDRAVGVVYSRPEKDGGFGFRDDWYGHWKQVAPARGKVSPPVGHHIRLDVAKAASRDLTFLNDLDPGVVEALFLEGTDVNDEQLKHIRQLTGLRFLDLSLTRISDSGFQHLANLRKLQRLDLSAVSVNRMGFGFGDEAMAVVAKLPALESISLRLTKVTDRGMAQLAECTSLRSISLSGTQVTDAGLEHLKKLPNLESLRLGVYNEGAKITDKGLKVLGEMTGLRSLGLSGTKVSDAGLRHLRGLKKLKSLSIDNTRVTNDGLRHLVGLPSLERIRAYNLADGDISDEGARHLSRIPSLVRITARLEVTDAGVAELAKLPKLESLALDGDGVRITNQAIQQVAGMKGLKRLTLSDCAITSEALSYLTRLENLEDLSISRRGLAADGLDHLRKLPKLRILRINFGSKASRPKELVPSLEPLGAMKQITWLEINGEGIDPGELLSISNLTQLNNLELGNDIVIDDDSVLYLANLKSLTHLEIEASTITDEGLQSLAGLDKLEYLTISCLASDEGLRHIEGMKSLRMLQIASPNLTSEGLEGLPAKMPSLQRVNRFEYRGGSNDDVGAGKL